MIPSYKTIARNVGIFGGAQAFSVLAALIRTKVAAVFIGTTGVGLSALYNTTVNFFATFSGLGLSFSSVKYLAEKVEGDEKDALEEEVRKIRSLGALLAVVGLALTIIFSPLISLIYFGDCSYVVEFASLSIFILLTILSGIEMAILKAFKKIRYMAIASIWAAVISVAVSVPFYIFMGVKGVIYAVLISGVLGSLIVVYYGIKTINVAYSLPSNIYLAIKQSKPLIILGLAFLGGGVVAYGSEMIIQSYLSSVATLSILGLYKAGYQLSITYSGMIFTAVNNDFYPRLSAVNNKIEERNILISRQIKVMLLVTIPLMSLFIVLVPYILPILFDKSFLPVVTMVQIASISIVIKSITMPLSFLPLSMGMSRDYLLLEGFFWILLVPMILIGYNYYGLTGTGIAILLCHIVELVYLYAFCKYRYGFTILVGKS